MDEYIYRPLAPNRDEIRLLRLLPAPPRGEVQIEIFHADTASNPSYEALSYVWGSSECTHEVCIRPTPQDLPLASHFARLSIHQSRRPRLQVLGISRNLSVALSYLTLPDRPRVLWIDAICINQKNRDEKSREVGRMGDIYSRARRVVVWLGESRNDTSLAIATLKSIGDGIELHDDDYLTVRPGSAAFHLRNEMRSPREARAKILIWIAIRSFFSAPWFTRLWVFQEIGRATDAIFVVGADYLQWDVLKKAFFWLDLETNISTSRRATIQILDKKTLDVAVPIFSLSQNFRYTPFSTLVELVYWTKLLSCYDPQDRIYAIRSLLEPDEAARIIPDYKKSPEEVYKEAILNTIRCTQSIEILEICDFPIYGSKLVLPSWVPDLSIPNTIEKITRWNPAGLSVDESRYDKTMDALILKGRHVCVINEVTTPIPMSAQLEEILAICHAWEPAHAWDTGYVTGGLIIDTFVNTLFHGATFDMPYITDKRDKFTLPALKAAYVSLVIKGKVSEDDDIYIRNFERFLPGRTLFITREGYIGLCSASARPGDQICVALGSRSPLLIRPVPRKKGYYQAGGGVFVYSLMHGEGILGQLPP